MKLTYDHQRSVGILEFGNGHKTVLRGSQSFCEKYADWIRREADMAFQKALARSRDSDEATRAKDYVLHQGVIARAGAAV